MHLDLKPTNLLDGAGRVWLLDFGVALHRGAAPPVAPGGMGGR
ncbi:MAG: hypothetical protein RMJ98_22615 [Myxococcales bacterium]|nr:hypothetical protein [Polyangiaceae bacterium]MDW8252098.1 hypothetical protein [Myxococcales bacterium]